MAQDQKPVEQQEYKGVGGFGNAVNEAVTWGGVAAVAGEAWQKSNLVKESTKMDGQNIERINQALGAMATGKGVPEGLEPAFEKVN